MNELTYVEGIALSALGFGAVVTIATYALRRYFFGSP